MMRRSLVILCLTLFASCSRVSEQLVLEEQTRIETLVRQLGDRDFKVREEATKKLIETGPDVLPTVRRTLQATDDPETRIRCERVLSEVRLVERVVKDHGPTPPDRWSSFVSPDWESYVFTVRRGETEEPEEAFVFDGKRSRWYGHIEETAWAVDPSRFIYLARDDGRTYVGVNGKETVYEWAGNLLLSPDRKRMVWRASRDGKPFLVLDGEEIHGYDEFRDAAFSPDGRYLVSFTRKKVQWMMLLDASAGPPHEGAYPAVFRDVPAYAAVDGKEVWLCRPELPAEGKALPAGLKEVRVRRLALLDEEYAALKPAVFFANDHCVVLWSGRRGGLRVYHDGRLIARHDVFTTTLSSADGKHAAPIVQDIVPGRNDLRLYAIVDGRAIGPYDQIGTAAYSADGRHLAFAARRDTQWLVVRDGKEGKPREQKPNRLVFSPDGEHLAAHWISDGTRAVVLDDKEIARYSGGFWMEDGALTFAPNDNRLAWMGERDEKQFIVVDGREGPALSEYIPWLQFSADGRHLCYAALARNEEGDWTGVSRLVIDGASTASGSGGHWPDEEPLERYRFTRYTEDHRFQVVEIPWPRALDWKNALEPVQRND